MCLTFVPAFPECPRWNRGETFARTSNFLHRVTLFAAIAALASSLVTPARAQQANPGFDPRQTEKHFDDLEPGQRRSAKPPLRVPSLERPEITADSKPLFVLRAISVIGVSAVLHEDLAATWRPYLGKKVSQAELAAIAQAIGDVYRAAGFNLSRAIIPPQDI